MILARSMLFVVPEASLAPCGPPNLWMEAKGTEWISFRCRNYVMHRVVTLQVT
jgi:hypothetical protein